MQLSEEEWQRCWRQTSPWWQMVAQADRGCTMATCAGYKEKLRPLAQVVKEEGGSASLEVWPGRARADLVWLLAIVLRPKTQRQHTPSARLHAGVHPQGSCRCKFTLAETQFYTPTRRHAPANTLGSTHVQLPMCHFAVSPPATDILQRDKLHSGKFSPLPRKCVNVALGMATLRPQGSPSKPGLQVSLGHTSVPGSCRGPGPS